MCIKQWKRCHDLLYWPTWIVPTTYVMWGLKRLLFSKWAIRFKCLIPRNTAISMPFMANNFYISLGRRTKFLPSFVFSLKLFKALSSRCQCVFQRTKDAHDKGYFNFYADICAQASINWSCYNCYYVTIGRDYCYGPRELNDRPRIERFIFSTFRSGKTMNRAF